MSRNEYPCYYHPLEEVLQGGGSVLGLGHQIALHLDLSSIVTSYVNVKRFSPYLQSPRVGGLLNEQMHKST